MLTKFFFRVMILYALIAFTMMFGGGILFLVTAAMAAFIFFLIRGHNKKSLEITRWASMHTMKARVLITVIQVLLLIIGLYVGFNLNRGGYELPAPATIVFSLIILTGFLSVPFLPVRNLIAIPRQVNRNRLAFLGIALSFFMMMVITGNKMENKYPGTIITKGLSKMDQLFFPGDEERYVSKSGKVKESELLATASSMAAMAAFLNYTSGSLNPVTDPEKEAKAKLKAEKKAKKLEKKKARQQERMKKRMGLAAAMGAGAVILIILLVLTTCAGVCLIIAGLSESAALIPLGLLIAAGSIYGIVQISKRNRKIPVDP